MHSLSSTSLHGQNVIVAGGTGNVGSFIVRALLERGANVVVPSRSEQKLDGLRQHLGSVAGGAVLDRFHGFIGDLSDEADAERLSERIVGEVGPPDAALASLGRWHSVPSLLSARADDFEPVLDGYLLAHFRVARTLLPLLLDAGGVYVSVNGPLAFKLWPGSRTDLVSIATAAQHMLFRALAQELEEQPVQVIELVTHAFIRNRQTQPGSPLPGEAVGAYAAYLLSGAADAHGDSIRLRSMEQLKEAGVSTESLT